MHDPHAPPPCTLEAHRQGCSCRMSSVNSATIDPPYEMIDPWCPLHGYRDPDREYDEHRDRMLERDSLDRLVDEYD